jgi:16S rRNA (guanine527-N7)-methyltransferase
MADDLAAAMAEHGIQLPGEQVALLDRYCTLLWEWNTKLNLTRHTDYRKFVTRDLADSLAFAEFLEPGETILDVGTGGGVPGVVLAVVRPDLTVSLCESVGKRARAVADIVDRLGLSLPVYEARAEDLLGPAKFNTLVVRAVARLARLLRWLRPHWQSFDRLLILKGPAWSDERGEARHQGLLRDLALRKLKSYPLPGTDSESVLLQICPKARMLDAKRCRITKLGEKPKAKARSARKRGGGGGP